MANWVRYRTPEGRVGFGTLAEEAIIEFNGSMFDSPVSAGSRIPRDGCTLLPPCVPGQIVALWNNFHALVKKLGKKTPSHPMFFLKSSSSLAGPQAALERPPGYTGKILFEAELGIVIGKTCRRISAAAAAEHIFGYTCVNDVTAIDLLSENPDFAQWVRSKSFDTFCCLGPVIATDFDWKSGRVLAHLDGVERQNYPLDDMVFSPYDLVSRISHDLTLMPGDVIACGTSLGVGSIKDGSTVDVEISGIGILANRLSVS